MKIYTSFFDNWRLLQHLNITPVSVTKRMPAGFSNMVVLSSLAPNEACEAAKKGRFLDTYRQEVLFRSSPYYVYQALRIISVANGNSDIALCDFNRPDNKNYRRQIALWLQKKLFITVDELPDGTKQDDLIIKEQGGMGDEEAKKNLQKAILRDKTRKHGADRIGMDRPSKINPRWRSINDKPDSYTPLTKK